MKGAIEKAVTKILHSTPNAWMPQQFNNAANPAIHEKTTAVEIWEDTDGKADILISAVGTGGTLTGVSRVLKQKKPGFITIAVEPEASPVISQTLAGEPVVPAPHKIQGTGAGFVPNNLDLKLVDEVIKVSNDDAFAMARRLAKRREFSSVSARGRMSMPPFRLRPARRIPGKLIVTIACSTGRTLPFDRPR